MRENGKIASMNARNIEIIWKKFSLSSRRTNNSLQTCQRNTDLVPLMVTGFQIIKVASCLLTAASGWSTLQAACCRKGIQSAQPDWRSVTSCAIRSVTEQSRTVVSKRDR